MKLKRKPHASQRGLTLIEVLVVIAILGMIVGIVGYNVVGATVDARLRTTEVQLSNLGHALDTFHIKSGRYPNASEGISILASPKFGIIREIPLDPWGNEYVYVPSDRFFKLTSNGPDGQPDTEDDLSF